MPTKGTVAAPVAPAKWEPAGSKKKGDAATPPLPANKIFIVPPSKGEAPPPPPSSTYGASQVAVEGQLPVATLPAPPVPPGMNEKIEPPGGHHSVLAGADSEEDLKLAFKLPAGFDTLADLKVAQVLNQASSREMNAAQGIMKGFGGM